MNNATCAFLDEIGIAYDRVEHSSTEALDSLEAANLLSEIPGASTRNILLQDGGDATGMKGSMYLATMGATQGRLNIPDMGSLVLHTVGLRMASRKQLNRVLHAEPGLLNPLSLRHDRSLALSEYVFDQETWDSSSTFRFLAGEPDVSVLLRRSAIEELLCKTGHRDVFTVRTIPTELNPV